MGKTIKSKVKLDEIYFDEELYPRSCYDWRTAYDYSQSIKAGSKFPKVILALFKGKKYLVDGKHRIEALKLLKKKEVNAITHIGWNKIKIYKEAIKSNITHGRGLSPYEKRLIAVKLMKMNCKNQEISKLICVPQDKLEQFIEQRLVNQLTGEVIDNEKVRDTAREIGQAILKSGVKQFAGEVLNNEDFKELQETQKSFNMISQCHAINQIVYLFEKDLIDKENNDVMGLIKRLKELLKDY